MSNFRILSLDGGGIKGTFTASALAELEKMTGQRFADHFDLIVGTSTGGIIALGLGLGISTEEILDFYTSRGPIVFPSTGLGRRSWSALRHVFRPKYSQKVLEGELTAIFGSRRFGESKCRLVVTSYDAVSGNIHLFKTAHHQRFKQDYNRRVVDVAMATAAAPTYYPAFTTKSGETYVDGGVWANCPVLVGLIEAIAVLKEKPEQVDILSLGATVEPYRISKTRRFGGWLLWHKGLVELLAQAQVASSIEQTKILTGHRALRIDVTTNVGRYSIGDARQISELKALGIRKARHMEHEISQRFLQISAQPFQPCRRVEVIGGTAVSN